MTEAEGNQQPRAEIWFEVEKDADGYPEPVDWEVLPARQIGGHFKIDGIPFYLKNVSLGDVVEATPHEVRAFVRVVERGGSSTYRLLLKTKREGDPASTMTELRSLGLHVEEQHGKFLAVDVPTSVDQQAIDALLIREMETGRWEMQDGYLHTIGTHRPEPS
jgi:hypothetical protein